jgi:hypothetical protein
VFFKHLKATVQAIAPFAVAYIIVLALIREPSVVFLKVAIGGGILLVLGFLVQFGHECRKFNKLVFRGIGDALYERNSRLTYNLLWQEVRKRNKDVTADQFNLALGVALRVGFIIAEFDPESKVPVRYRQMKVEPQRPSGITDKTMISLLDRRS